MNQQPVLFIGHGSPMNALGGNTFTDTLHKLHGDLPAPKAILVFSAHWETEGSKVLAAAKPKTIHDFYGFPEALFQMQYPAPGSPELAENIAASLDLETSLDWGFDHGTWSILAHLFPKADIPVFQLSLDRKKSFAAHAELARELSTLRDQGVLMIGSGNLVHNLRQIRWEPEAKAYDWALEIDQVIADRLENGDVRDLVALPKTHERLYRQAHPSDEHFLPLIYSMALKSDQDSIKTIFSEMQNGSISMRSVQISASP